MRLQLSAFTLFQAKFDVYPLAKSFYFLICFLKLFKRFSPFYYAPKTRTDPEEQSPKIVLF